MLCCPVKHHHLSPIGQRTSLLAHADHDRGKNGDVCLLPFLVVTCPPTAKHAIRLDSSRLQEVWGLDSGLHRAWKRGRFHTMPCDALRCTSPCADEHSGITPGQHRTLSTGLCANELRQSGFEPFRHDRGIRTMLWRLRSVALCVHVRSWVCVFLGIAPTTV